MTQVGSVFHMDPCSEHDQEHEHEQWYDPMDIDIKIPKKVHFSEVVEVRYTYSREVYDRSVIDSVVVLRNRHKVNDFEWRKLFIELNQFKIYEMRVHPNSKENTILSKIPPIQIPSFQANKYLPHQQ